MKTASSDYFSVHKEQFYVTFLAFFFFGFLIFTPERLVFVRDAGFWVLCTWAAWHCYGCWLSSALLRDIVTALAQGRGLSGVSAAILAREFRPYISVVLTVKQQLQQTVTNTLASISHHLGNMLSWFNGSHRASGMLTYLTCFNLLFLLCSHDS